VKTVSTPMHYVLGVDNYLPVYVDVSILYALLSVLLLQLFPVSQLTPISHK